MSDATCHVHSCRLWPGPAPCALGDEDADIPTITIYHPADPTGAALVVCPGGGYVFHASYEAEPVARWLNSLGVTAVLLKYRLAPRYSHPAPYLDLSRAVRTLRAKSGELSLDHARVGVVGFSAGGHLAAHLSVCFDAGDGSSCDPIERCGCHPNLAVLLYPVISFTELSSHTKTWQNLLGADSASRQVRESLSCERHVSAQTPPTFIYHATGDPNVPIDNALIYAAALRGAGVSFELHAFDRVAHGVGLASNDPVLGTWPELCATWLRGKGFGR